MATPGTKRALVASDSNLKSDPRILNQIQWLTTAGWTVDSFGHGGKPPQLNGRHFELRSRSFPIRLLSYVFLTNQARFRVLMEWTTPADLRKGTIEPYDLAIVNEIDLLPWFTANVGQLMKPGGHRHLDLHEYSPSQGVGFVWKLLIGNYRTWLTGFIPSPEFDSRSVVAPGIADLYVDLFHIPRPVVIRSCPSFVPQDVSPVDEGEVRLIHHGKADLDRGLDLLINAMAELDDRFSLTLMLVGSPAIIRKLKALAARLGARVIFREPVPVREVARVLNEYDLEVIFFPPTTENLLHALPNKFFEAIQGRLGLVIGPSPEMAELVAQYQNGVVSPGWSAGDLAETINKLKIDQINELKRSSLIAAEVLSSEQEAGRFLNVIGATT